MSTRGIGGGVGPVSAGTRWGGGGCLNVLGPIIGVIVLVAWPYWLGTWVAVTLGAGNPSTVRTAVGWTFEGVWTMVLLFFAFAYFAGEDRARKEPIPAAEATALKRRVLAHVPIQLGDVDPAWLRAYPVAMTWFRDDERLAAVFAMDAGQTLGLLMFTSDRLLGVRSDSQLGDGPALDFSNDQIGSFEVDDETRAMTLHHTEGRVTRLGVLPRDVTVDDAVGALNATLAELAGENEE